MPVETDADRAAFLDVDEFGAVASWSVGGNPPVDIPCIFDDDYLLLQAGDFDAGQEGSQPRILVRSSDVPAGAGHGDAITVTSEVIPGGAASFVLVEMQPDGTGMSTMRLQEPGA